MRMKLLAASALSGVLVLATVGSAFAHGAKGGQGEFKDLGNAQFAQSAITMLAAQGLVNGVSQTQFDPGAPITLRQLGAILLRYEGKVTSQTSFTGQVQTAEEDGYFRGIGGAGPGNDATRAQAMAMIASALGLQGPSQGAGASLLGSFHDRGKIPAWARGSLALGVQLGLLQGDGGNLLPQGDVTRAELAVILMRVEQLLGYGQAVQNSTVRGTFVSAGTSTNASGQTQDTVTVSVYGPGATSGTGTSGTGGIDLSGSAGTTGAAQAGTNETFTVSPVAQIFYGNQSSTLASFQPGDPIFVALDQDGEAGVIVDTAPTQVQTQAGTVTGTVYQVGSGSITITAPSSGQGQNSQGDGADQGNLGPGTYSLSSSVGVVLGGMSASLSDVQPGDLVKLVVDASGQVTLIIVKAETASASGTIAMVREDWFAVATSNGFVRVEVSSGTELTRNGQAANLQDLQIGDQVQAQGVMGEGGLAAQTVTATGSAAPSPLNDTTNSTSND